MSEPGADPGNERNHAYGHDTYPRTHGEPPYRLGDPEVRLLDERITHLHKTRELE
jgi:hypothetical protein